MPAPVRYVVTRPGASGAYDSPYVSSWIQPADQEAPATLSTQAIPDTGVPALVETVALGGATYIDDGPAPDEPPGEITAFAQLITDTTSGGPADGPGAFWYIRHDTWHVVGGNPNGTDDDPAQLGHNLEGSRGASGVTVAVSAQEIEWKDAWRPPSWPDSAIGYEVDQVELNTGFWAAVAEPLSVDLEVTLDPHTDFGQVTGLLAVAALNSQWGAGPVEWAYAGLVLDRTVHQLAPNAPVVADDFEFGFTSVEVPLEGELDAPHVATFALDDFSYAPPYTGALGFHSQVGKLPGGEADPVPVLEDGVRLEVTANASIDGTYVIRPPRFRWIYARAPYRRITDRGDSLAGGALRVGGRTKTIQGSNRRGPGAIV